MNKQKEPTAIDKAEIDAALSEATAMAFAERLAKDIRQAKAEAAGEDPGASESVKNRAIAICEVARLATSSPEETLTAIHALVLLASEKFGGGVHK